MYTAALQEEEVEELHLSCGWKGDCAACGQECWVEAWMSQLGRRDSLGQG